MDKKENGKTDFDLSVLSYKELIDLNYLIEDFVEEMDSLKAKLEKEEGSDD